MLLTFNVLIIKLYQLIFLTARLKLFLLLKILVIFISKLQVIFLKLVTSLVITFLLTFFEYSFILPVLII